MVIHKLQFSKSTVTLYRQWEIEQKQPVQMADTKTNETRNREVNSLYWKFPIFHLFTVLYAYARFWALVVFERLIV